VFSRVLGDAVLRKTLKWGGFFVAAIVLWLATVLIASAVVKSRVPVSLSAHGNVVSIRDVYASATGTWVIEGQQQAYPLQTTNIRCEKELRRCTSGTARVMAGDQLHVDLDVHDIVSWEKSRIVFVDDVPKCVQYIYTIDLITNVVNGIRRKRPDVAGDASDCAALDQELRLSLKGGFEQWWKLNQDAMPWFGKLALAPFKLFH
jgi:hypothetical protein